MRSLVRYHTLVYDSARWEGFRFREGDIVISTPPKCGTTWTQTICALLIFQTPHFPQAMDLISPWLDMLTRSRQSVVADLEAQEHRRFIKTHTPLNGLPFDERATYITVGRDPRDVAMSWDNHMQNLDIPALIELRGKAVGNDDLEEVLAKRPPDIPGATEIERFWQWVDQPAGPDVTIGGLDSFLHHMQTFWEVRDRPNVVMLHYGDMKDDLSGQMRHLAGRLGIEVPEGRWDELVHAATFEEMKRRATEVAPNTTEPIWRDTGRFFNKGTVGQWRELLDEESLRRYAARLKELGPPQELLRWVHRGPISG